MEELQKPKLNAAAKPFKPLIDSNSADLISQTSSAKTEQIKDKNLGDSTIKIGNSITKNDTKKSKNAGTSNPNATKPEKLKPKSSRDEFGYDLDYNDLRGQEEIEEANAVVVATE